jgi:hypothetical protein
MTRYRVTVTSPERQDASDHEMGVREVVIRTTTSESLQASKALAIQWLDEHHQGEAHVVAAARQALVGWDGTGDLAVVVPASNGDLAGLVRVSLAPLAVERSSTGSRGVRVALVAALGLVVLAGGAGGIWALVGNPFGGASTASGTPAIRSGEWDEWDAYYWGCAMYFATLQDSVEDHDRWRRDLEQFGDWISQASFDELYDFAESTPDGLDLMELRHVGRVCALAADEKYIFPLAPPEG